MTRLVTSKVVSKIGKEVELSGWINSRRDHGKIVFFDLRDRDGIIQIVIVPDKLITDKKIIEMIRPEWVIHVVGTVKKRPESMINPKLQTGAIEIEAKSVNVLAKSKELPFPIDTPGYDIGEDIRLKYRYIDLRRRRLKQNIKLRSTFIQNIRQFLFNHDFVEIETPILTKSTPEGSRDFIVPSRFQQGKFYALPQSPQQYKQLLMVAGFERYFQIARCLRDEDLRSDRGFEHTQIDIEMSFVKQKDVMAKDEELMTAVMEKMGYTIKKKPFPIFSYKEAVSKFGSDKFDLRTKEEKKKGILAFAWVVDFPFFEKTDKDEWTFTHNPFSNPKPEHKEWLLKKDHIGDILTSQYDLVCNGYEVGGGSMRSNDPQVLQSVFEIIGYSPKAIKKQFGHMLEAFQYGVPPHGGLAHGVERLLMTLTNEPYLREVVAFPMTSSGRTSVMDAPNWVDPVQLSDLGISITKVSREE